MGVAYYIATLGPEKVPSRIRIHSSNVGAALAMCDIMHCDFKNTYKLFNKEDYENAEALRDLRNTASKP